MSDDSNMLRALKRHQEDAVTDLEAALFKAGALNEQECYDARIDRKKGRPSRTRPENLIGAIHAIQQKEESLRTLAADRGIEVPAPRSFEYQLGIKRRDRNAGSDRRVIPLYLLPDTARGLPADALTQAGKLNAKAREALAVQFNEDAKHESADRLKIVKLMQKRATAQEAIEQSNVLTTPRTARRWFAEYKKTGKLLDHRHIREHLETRMDPQLVKFAVTKWAEKKDRSIRAVHKALVKHVAELNELSLASLGGKKLQTPSFSTVRLLIKRLPKSVHEYRESPDYMQKRLRLFENLDDTTRPNEIWDVDCKKLDVRIAWYSESEGGWREKEVYIVVVLDVFSRAVMGWTLSTHSPNADIVMLAMRNAMLMTDDKSDRLFGPPEHWRPDFGKELRNERSELSMAQFGAELLDTVPNYPNSHPFIESLNRTIQARLCDVAGTVRAERGIAMRERKMLAAKLSFVRLYDEIRGAVNEYNNTPHSVTGEKPAVRWLENANVRTVSEIETLILLMPHKTTRVVQGSTVQFNVGRFGGDYQHEALAQYDGRDVIVRYDPEDMRKIWIFDYATKDFICAAYEQSLVTRTERDMAHARISARLKEAIAEPMKEAKKLSESRAREEALRNGQPPLTDSKGRVRAHLIIESERKASQPPSAAERHESEVSPTLAGGRFRAMEAQEGAKMLGGVHQRKQVANLRHADR